MESIVTWLCNVPWDGVFVYGCLGSAGVAFVALIWMKLTGRDPDDYA